MLSSIQNVNFKNSFTNITIGEIAGLILPFRMGDVIRWHLVNKKEGISYSKVFPLLFMERLLDFITLFGLLITGLRFSTSLQNALSQQIIERIFLLGLILFMLFLSVLIVIFINEKPLLNFIVKLLKFLKPNIKAKMLAFLTNNIRYLKIFKNWRFSIICIIITLLIWIFSSIVYFNIGKLFNLGQKFQFYESAFLNGFLTFAVFIPAAPGAVGTFEYFIILILTTLGVNHDTASSYSLFTRFFSTLFFLIMSIPFLILDRFHLKNYINNSSKNK